MVLWLTAALSAIAFSLATTTGGEIERTSTAVDGVRSYYIAAGAVDRAILYMLWGPDFKQPDGAPRYWAQGTPRLRLRFPAGDAVVDVLPANAYLNINAANEQDLYQLLLAVGANDGQARLITAGIMEWRTPGGRARSLRFDEQYLGRGPSFSPRHASLEETEELLLIRGMTPELYYGSYVRDGEGRLVRRSGLRDCVSVYGVTTGFAVNAADPALLRAIGVPPPAVQQVVEMRRHRPIYPPDLEQLRVNAGPAASRLVVGGRSLFTIRATGRRRLEDGSLSDLRRTVAATVKFLGYGFDPPYHVLRWYDQAPADNLDWQ